MLGTKKMENKTMPANNRILAPGKCNNLNKTPTGVREKDKAPVINANFFIWFVFIFSYS